MVVDPGFIMKPGKTLDPVPLAAERLHALTQAAPDAIVSADAYGVIIDWNPAAETIFGYAAADALGQSLEILMPERFRVAHRRGMAAVAVGESRSLSARVIEVVGLHKSGHEFPIELSLSKWQARGEFGFTGIIRDCSHRIARLQQLSELSSLISEVLRGHVLNGRYRLDRLLDQRQNWVLYEATDLEQQGQVWVRLLRPSAKDLAAPAWADDLATPCSAFEHEFVAEVFEQGRSDIMLAFVVSEALSGESLQLRNERDRIPTTQILEWLQQIGEAMSAAHASEIVHGDLRLENVFLHEPQGHSPRVKLINVGLLRYCAQSERAVTRPCTKETDVENLGQVAMQLFLHSASLKGDDLVMAFATLELGLSPELRALVLGAVHRDPSERPSMGQLTEGLIAEAKS